MMILTETTDAIEVVLAGAVTTNELDIVASWRDITTSAYTPGRTLSRTSGTTPVDAVGGPASSTQRVVDFLVIRNTDTVAATVTVRFDANGTEYVLWSEVLEPGDTLAYHEGVGFTATRTFQSIKIFTVHGDAGANWALTNATLAERLASNSSRTIFMVDLAGYTQVRLRANQQVTGTAASAFRAKYYTEFTTAVGNFIQLGLSGEVGFATFGTGYRDTGWVSLAHGARINGCCIGFTELGGDGVADPAFGAMDILFR